MKRSIFLALFILPVVAFAQANKVKQQEKYPAIEKVSADFLAMLQRPRVNFNPSFQLFTTVTSHTERGYIYTEENEKVPIVIYKPVHSVLKSFPVIICLHGTGGSKDDESIKDMFYRLSKIGIMGVAIDARFHGERIPGGANQSQQYVEAITKAWKDSVRVRQQHPFFYDTVYDLWRLIDYLVTRSDVQPDRIGMMGISMGGIETWMAASVDKRIKVAVPVIAAQSFKWSLENNQWQGRAKTIWKVHEQAAVDLKDSNVTKDNVNAVWVKLIPGITGEFDCPSMIRLFAPRPLLLLSNEKDQNCPLEGAKIAFKAAEIAYKLKGASDKLGISVTPDQPHRFLPQHAEMTVDWFKRWL